VLSDPDAETYQFVIKSVRDNGTQELAQLSERVTELTDRMHHENVRTAVLRKQLFDQEELVVQVEEQRRYIDALEGHVGGLEHNVEVLNEALEKSERERTAVTANYNAVLGMRTVQLTAPIRWVYNKLFRTKTRAT
jgi:septal ring factor EnvC (AmiA/AmiB activator)